MSERAERVFTDVVAVEKVAPQLLKVVTWADAYTVDARDAGCLCPDKEYRGVPRCKHDFAALAADVDWLPNPGIVTDDLSHRDVATDGGRPSTCLCDELPEDEQPCFACHNATEDDQ